MPYKMPFSSPTSSKAILAPGATPLWFASYACSSSSSLISSSLHSHVTFYLECVNDYLIIHSNRHVIQTDLVGTCFIQISVSFSLAGVNCYRGLVETGSARQRSRPGQERVRHVLFSGLRAWLSALVEIAFPATIANHTLKMNTHRRF